MRARINIDSEPRTLSGRLVKSCACTLNVSLPARAGYKREKKNKSVYVVIGEDNV